VEEPVTGLAANFSPTPRMAPPPFGRVTGGARTWKPSLSVSLFSLFWSGNATICYCLRSTRRKAYSLAFFDIDEKQYEAISQQVAKDAGASP